MSKHGAGMQNDEGKNVELYIPRKCSATNRIIGAKDHAAIQVCPLVLPTNCLLSDVDLCGAKRTADSAVLAIAIFVAVAATDVISTFRLIIDFRRHLPRGAAWRPVGS
jgi:hypothetical protein